MWVIDPEGVYFFFGCNADIEINKPVIEASIKGKTTASVFRSGFLGWIIIIIKNKLVANVDLTNNKHK